MATFTPKNFPRDVGNNRSFSGAGERTTYAPDSKTGYKFTEGFPTKTRTPLFTARGRVEKYIPQGTKVHFTYPATLHRSHELGISKRFNLAPVSLSGYDKEPDGYIAISAVIKPAGGAQGRVGSGSKTQDMAAAYIKESAFNAGIEVEEEFKTARPGSTLPDLEMTISQKKTQFEIKGTNNRTAPITFFDKSVRRNSLVPKVINEIAEVYIQTLSIGSQRVSTLMQTRKLKRDFVGLMDLYRAFDPSIGFAGDKGTVKSGKLPAAFSITNNSTLRKLRDVILKHFREGGDDYFIVHNRSNDKYEVYFVGGGDAGNVLKAKDLPMFKSFTLATYGGASGGATRVGLKIQL